jgi:hypothetical protein
LVARNCPVLLECCIDRPRHEIWDEQDLRIQTGGPLFTIEKGDVVRSTRINIVRELASVFPFARNCPVLLECCIDTLRLELSRPVGRAGASLARELYSALIHEKESLTDHILSKKYDLIDIPISVGMALSGKEDVLNTTLRR